MKFSYVALVTQSGENPPVATVKEEGILRCFFKRSSAGTYIFGRDVSFLKNYNNETYPGNLVSTTLLNGDVITFQSSSPSEITVKTYSSGDLDSPIDGILNEYEFGLSIEDDDLKF